MHIHTGGHGCVGDFPRNKEIKAAVEYVYGKKKMNKTKILYITYHFLFNFPAYNFTDRVI